jgi:hypothetical protein
MQASPKLLLVHKYASFYTCIYASGNQALEVNLSKNKLVNAAENCAGIF